MLVFLAGSAGVALADDLWWLVGARVVQAIGGGAVVPVAIALAIETLPGSRRGLAIGLIAAVAEGGATLGPLYGGGIIEIADWRWIFWSNIPIGAAIMIPMFLWVKNERRPGLQVDYVGGLLLGVSLSMLALGLSHDAVLPGGSGWQASFLVGSAVSLVLFFRWELVAKDPLLPMSLFRRVPMGATYLVSLMVGGALILALVDIPLMTNAIMGESPLEGGLRLLRLTVMIPVGAVLGGLAYQRWGYWLPMSSGLGFAALGFGFLTLWPLDIGEPRLTLELMAAGLGFGLVITPITANVLSLVREDQKATASALVTVMRMVGMTVAVSALSWWGQERFETLVARVPVPMPVAGETEAAFGFRQQLYQFEVVNAGLNFFHELFFVAMAICLIALVPAFFMWRRARKPG